MTCHEFGDYSQKTPSGDTLFFDSNMIHQCEEKFGMPHLLRLNYPTPQKQLDFIRSTQKNDRAHDVTLLLKREGLWAVTRKPQYPATAYRTPSGGVHPGETVEEGSEREGMEELGIPIRLKRYLLRVRVDFVGENDRIRWTTHVFLVDTPLPGLPKLDPQDRHEIAEAKWATDSEVRTTMRQGLIAAGTSGLLYRAHLQDVVGREL
jgi:8-oxo-dGTP pyrophosphatase MutT (NUDIX family)